MKSIFQAFIILALFSICPAYAITIEAENATIKTTGKPIENGWNLHSNGTLGEYVRIQTAGKYEVKINAYGTPLGGIWPLMALNIDGVPGDTQTVNKSEPSNYIFQINISQGVHSIGAAFLNDDYHLGGEDRNLYIDKIEINTTQSLQEPLLSSEEEWALEAKDREDAVLKKIDDSIKKNRMGSATITVLDSEGNPMPGVTITIEQIQHDFLFGCNLFMFDKFGTEKENTTYKNRFKELFNYATLPFYWNSFESEQGKPKYTEMDKLVEWAKTQKIRPKGHPLLWDCESGIPPWSSGQPSLEIQKKRVADIIKRYQGSIDIWEVVNEPAHLTGIDISEPINGQKKLPILPS